MIFTLTPPQNRSTIVAVQSSEKEGKMTRWTTLYDIKFNRLFIGIFQFRPFQLVLKYIAYIF